MFFSERRGETEAHEVEFWAKTGARAAGTKSQAAQQLHNGKNQNARFTSEKDSDPIRIII